MLPSTLMRTPVDVRLQHQMEDYAWKIKFIAMDFPTRAELEAWAKQLVTVLVAHTHNDSTGAPTGPALNAGVLVGTAVSNPGLAEGVVLSRESWLVLAGDIVQPFEILNKLA